MNNVVITVDSAADLPKEIAEKYDIQIMPMYVVMQGKAMRDGANVTTSEIFDYVDRTGEIPKTSAVPPGEYSDFFEKFLKSGKSVVHLSFCAALSSTCRNAQMAASMLENVFVIDTQNLAGGIGLLAIKGCEMRDSGKSAQEIFSELTLLIPRVKVSYLLDSIDFLRRSGRCSAAAAIGANLLSIKPCAAMIDSEIKLIKKYRGKIKSARLQYANERIEVSKNIDFSTAFIYHSGVDAGELSAVEKILKNAGFEQVITAFTGCMISLHSGRGALGIHFIAD